MTAAGRFQFRKVRPATFVLSNGAVSRSARSSNTVGLIAQCWKPGRGERVAVQTKGERRAFLRYWRVIGTGSAVLRRMLLRAVKVRAERHSFCGVTPRGGNGTVLFDGGHDIGGTIRLWAPGAGLWA